MELDLLSVIFAEIEIKIKLNCLLLEGKQKYILQSLTIKTDKIMTMSNATYIYLLQSTLDLTNRLESKNCYSLYPNFSFPFNMKKKVKV